ncbi:GNAT family N-acetyltransferase [Actinoplanes philippinensis]|uniref:GNAT family N-acetyltransferase n=1 Tax=Actinoplanes philippinensis TaxID=35752 RepID=UPI00340DABD2
MSPIRLRPLRASDAEVIAGWASDPQFRAAAAWTDRSPAEHLSFHRTLIATPPAGLLRLGAVHDGFLVGYVDLHGTDPDGRELGFVIGERSRWGAGLGRAAAAAGIAHGFEKLALLEIRAEADDHNRRSIRILESLGMTLYDRSGSRHRFVLRAPPPGR